MSGADQAGLILAGGVLLGTLIAYTFGFVAGYRCRRRVTDGR